MNLARALVALFIASLSLAAAGPRSSRGEDGEREPWKFDFGAEVLASVPRNELDQKLDSRRGMGIGMQWTEFRNDRWLKRTRWEWFTYPESAPVGPGQVKTQLKTFSINFDQVVFFAPEPIGPYVVIGLGGVRSFIDQTAPAGRTRDAFTKLQVTGGLGIRLANQVSIEARYVSTSLYKSQDASSIQACLGWHF